jgi:hypothetical protein
MFPRFLSVALFAFSVLLYLRRLDRKPLLTRITRDKSTPSTYVESARTLWQALPSVRMPLGTFGWIVVYGVLMNVLGFFTSSALYMLGTMVFLGNRSWWLLIIVPMLMTCFLYLVFKWFLGVHVPVGYFM